MSNDGKTHSLNPEDIPSKSVGSTQEAESLFEVAPEDPTLFAPIAINKPEAIEAIEQQAAPDASPAGSVACKSQTDEAVAVKQEQAALPETGTEAAVPSDPADPSEKPEADGSPLLLVTPEPQAEKAVPSIAANPIFVRKRQSFLEEQSPPIVEMAPHVVRYRTRREVLAFGIGAVAGAAATGYLLPQNTLGRLGVSRDLNSRAKEWLLNNALRFDDDVAEALYSGNQLVPTYTRSQITPIKNNYNGTTPEPWYISGWKLTLDGLASGLSVPLDIRTLTNRFSVHDQITRFVCVEGWSAIAWWAGVRFDDLLRAYPPKSQAKWARVESSVNLDNSGNPDPYFVSIDLATARHPQTLLATHHDGQPLTVEHGAPLRLLVPVKLGLKNVKAITRITYSAEEPRDYWTPYGYSAYDGI
jgi:DMSO/TMAO reductase YedYZ molybdopterin-dependent catalytic subunit